MRRQMRAAVVRPVAGVLLAAALMTMPSASVVVAGADAPPTGEDRQAALAACVKEYGDDQQTQCSCAFDEIDRMFQAGQRAAPYYVLGMSVAQQMDFLLGDEKASVPLTEDIVFDVTDIMNGCTIGLTDPAKDK